MTIDNVLDRHFEVRINANSLPRFYLVEPGMANTLSLSRRRLQLIKAAKASCKDFEIHRRGQRWSLSSGLWQQDTDRPLREQSHQSVILPEESLVCIDLAGMSDIEIHDELT